MSAFAVAASYRFCEVAGEPIPRRSAMSRGDVHAQQLSNFREDLRPCGGRFCFSPCHGFQRMQDDNRHGPRSGGSQLGNRSAKYLCNVATHGIPELDALRVAATALLQQ